MSTPPGEPPGLPMLRALPIRELRIPFRQAFRHASAERARTQSLWVQAVDAAGHTGNGECCPREYVTGEGIDDARAFIAAHQAGWRARLRSLADLQAWVSGHRADIDRQPAAWCAVELALLDLLGQRARQPVEALLGLPPLQESYRYSAVLGDADPRAFAAQLQQYAQAGFRDFKLKLSGDLARDAAKVAALRSAGIAPERTRADANNLWRDAGAAIAHLRALDWPFMGIEEPLAAGDWAGMASIASALGCRIILDESALRVADLAYPARQPGCWAVNLRISKMGGLLRSLECIAAARQAGIALIVGAHVGETSLLTRVALTAATAAGAALIAQEGAFGTHLLAQDIVEPPLMFGAGGVLQAKAWCFAEKPGFGLQPLLPPEPD